MNRHYLLYLVVLAGLVCIIAGCTSVDTGTGPSTVTSTATPLPVSPSIAGSPNVTVSPSASVPAPVMTGPLPSISIDSPNNGAILLSGPITISVNVRNFALTDPAGQANIPGEGHIRYFMDIIAGKN